MKLSTFQKFSLANAESVLRMILGRYAKYLKPEEVDACNLLIDSIGNLQERIENPPAVAAEEPPIIDPGAP